MSRRRSQSEPEPTLFDLPLDGPIDGELPAGEAPWDAEAPVGAAPPAAEPARPWGADPLSLPLGEPEAPREPDDREQLAPATLPVALSARFLAGLADLAVHLAVAVTLLFGARLLGVAAGPGEGPAILLFLLVFSFLYAAVPLAFWGQTPGMAWAGLAARTPAGETLTFRQTALRWLGGVVSVLLLGLPVLLAVRGGGSLADRLSGSTTKPA